MQVRTSLKLISLSIDEFTIMYKYHLQESCTRMYRKLKPESMKFLNVHCVLVSLCNIEKNSFNTIYFKLNYFNKYIQN